MTVIFIGPLVLSVIEVARYLYAGEKNVMKIIGALAVGGSIPIQFMPNLGMHFLVPLFMQIAVILVFEALWKLES